MTTEAILGIDLGASAITVAVCEGGAPRVVVGGREWRPSSVARGGRGLVAGEEADRISWQRPDLAVTRWKALLGRAFASRVSRQSAGLAGLCLADAAGEAAVVLGGAQFNPVDLASTVLHVSLEEARSRGVKATACALAVPGAFTRPQCRALESAAERVGLEVRRLVRDTAAIAAAEIPASTEGRFVVIDVGALRGEVALVEVSAGGARVLARRSDPRAGGDEVHASLHTWLLDEIERERRTCVADDAMTWEWLRHELSRALASCDEGDLSLAAVPPVDPEAPAAGATPPWVIPAAVTRAALRHAAVRLMALSEAVRAAAGPRDAAVDGVLLSGGIARTSLVREGLAKVWSRPPHPVGAGAVARGAASLGAGVVSVADDEPLPVASTPAPAFAPASREPPTPAPLPRRPSGGFAAAPRRPSGISAAAQVRHKTPVNNHAEERRSTPPPPPHPPNAPQGAGASQALHAAHAASVQPSAHPSHPAVPAASPPTPPHGERRAPLPGPPAGVTSRGAGSSDWWPVLRQANLPTSGRFRGIADLAALRALPLGRPPETLDPAPPLPVLLLLLGANPEATGRLSMTSAQGTISIPLWHGAPLLPPSDRGPALRMFQWQVGTWTFSQTESGLSGQQLRESMVAFVASGVRVVLRACLTPEAEPLLEPHLSLVPAFTPESLSKAQRIGLAPGEQQVLNEFLASNNPLRQLLDDAGGRRQTLLAAVLLADTFGLLKWQRASQTPTQGAFLPPAPLAPAAPVATGASAQPTAPQGPPPSSVPRTSAQEVHWPKPSPLTVHAVPTMSAAAARVVAMQTPNNFDVLGVHWSSSPAEILTAADAIRRDFGPNTEAWARDQSACEAIQTRVNEALASLKDHVARAKHRKEMYPDVDPGALVDLLTERINTLSLENRLTEARDLERLRNEIDKERPKDWRRR